MHSAKRSTRPRRQSAFTLIEVMVALSIIGILSALAYPSYRQAQLKMARAEGRAALLQLMQQQQRQYTAQRRYRPFSAGDETGGLRRFSGPTREASAYLMEALTCPGQDDARDCILLRAVPAPGFDDPLCAILTLRSDGTQGAAGTVGPERPAGCL